MRVIKPPVERPAVFLRHFRNAPALRARFFKNPLAKTNENDLS